MLRSGPCPSIDSPKIVGKARSEAMLKALSDKGTPASALKYKEESEYPHRDELQSAIFKDLLDRSPSLLLSDVQAKALACNIMLIFTVPHCPDSQPIEKLWNTIKAEAAKLYKRGTKPDDLIQRVLNIIVKREMYVAFGPDGKPKENAEMTAYINKSLEWIAKEMVPESREEFGITGDKLGSYAFSAAWQAQLDDWIGNKAKFFAYFAKHGILALGDDAPLLEEAVEVEP